MLRSTRFVINQNDRIINQNEQSNNFARKQIEATQEQTESINNVNKELEGLNKPTITIKLEEYEKLKNKNIDYNYLINSIEKVMTIENTMDRNQSLNMVIGEDAFVKLIVDSLVKKKITLHDISIENIKNMTMNVICSNKKRW